MNPYQMQGQMESLSDDQIMQVNAPSFMKIAELQRRKDMRDGAVEAPSSTVMEDLVSGEGYAGGGMVGYRGPVDPSYNPVSPWDSELLAPDSTDPRYQQWLKWLARSALESARNVALPGVGVAGATVPGAAEALRRFGRYATEVPGQEPLQEDGTASSGPPYIPGGVMPPNTGDYIPPSSMPQAQEPTAVMGPPAPTMEQMVREQLEAPAEASVEPDWIKELRGQMPKPIDYTPYMERREQLAREGLDQNKWLALANMGFGMMASESPFFAGAAGEGGLRGMATRGEGMQAYQQALSGVIGDTMAAQVNNADITRGNINSEIAMRNAQLGGEDRSESRKLARLQAILEARKADQLEEYNKARIAKLRSGVGGGMAPKDIEAAARELALAMVGSDDGTQEWKIAFAKAWREQYERILNTYGARGMSSPEDDETAADYDLTK